MDLTGLVQHLRQISETALRERLPSRAAEVLHDALKAHWAGKTRQAVEAITELLAEDPDTVHRFAAYRLWIEGLAELKERTSLALLSEHLFLRGQAEPDDQETYLALRGIIDLELDAVQAVRLSVKALRDARHNPYALELVQIFHNRVFEDARTHGVPALLNSSAPITDYHHWLTIARGVHLVRNDEGRTASERDEASDAMDEVFEHVREVFRGSPLPSLFAFHSYVQSRDFGAATIMAHELARAYPENVDFLYYHAYALFEDGNYPAARQVLNNTLGLAGERDPEILSLLGHCNAKLGDPERARHYLERSTELLRAEGLPHAHTHLELSEVEADLRKGKPDPKLAHPGERSYWLVELSPRRYHEMLTSTDESLSRLIRPMGIGAKPGDVAYFGTQVKDADGHRVWKIIADYTVDSVPMWHPTQSYHSSLRLDARFEVGVPVPGLTTRGRGPTKQEQGYHDLHEHFGVFELDQRGFERIAESLKDHFAEHFTERRIDGGRTRTDVG
jgi:tetratricopeptide (TPR) repeat protein